MSPQSIYRALREGKMQAQGSALSDAEKVQLAEFLTRKKIGEASQDPEPPACKGKAAKFDFNEPPAFANWGLSPGNSRFVPADYAGINKSNIGKLHLKWAFAFPNAVQARSEPMPAAGALFVGSHNGGVYALDRETGCARWIYQAGSEVRTGIVVSPWKKGDTKAKPMAFFGDIFGFVYAVDAQTGKEVWRVRADAHPNITLTGAPTLYNNTLYVPISQMEAIRPSDPMYECCTARGAVAALNPATGEIKWKTYSVDTPQPAGVNAKGAKRFSPSGSSIWNSPAIDVKRHQFYVGTGPTSTSPAVKTSDAIIAMDLDTGAVKWVYQGLEGDAGNLACLSVDKTNCPVENGPDFDFGAGAILAKATDGRDVVLAGQKSGAIHAIDPDTGKLLWRDKPGRGSALGGVLFSIAANQDAVYVPVSDALDKDRMGVPFKEPGHPGIYAYDIGTGKQIWAMHGDPTTCTGLTGCTSGYSQAITATPDLLVAGSADAWLRIIDTKTGEVLWKVNSKVPVKTVAGTEKSGGAFSGGAGPVLYHGMLIASSGYNRIGMTGALLMVFDVK
jgi:polyvinyl alcohol dehydrogenase (cytochrome)